MDDAQPSTSTQSLEVQFSTVKISDGLNTNTTIIEEKTEQICATSVAASQSVNTEEPQQAILSSPEDDNLNTDNCGFGGGGYYDSQEELKHEREEIAKAVLNKQITPGRAKLQMWLYRSLRIVMTDGRILIGIFLCTDSDANVILGVCSEFTKDGGDERMLGLVMVPGIVFSNCKYSE